MNRIAPSAYLDQPRLLAFGGVVLGASGARNRYLSAPIAANRGAAGSAYGRVCQWIEGDDPDRDLVVTNTKYRMGADITVAEALKGKVRDSGRVWNRDGRSAEICQIEWSDP